MGRPLQTCLQAVIYPVKKNKKTPTANPSTAKLIRFLVSLITLTTLLKNCMAIQRPCNTVSVRLPNLLSQNSLAVAPLTYLEDTPWSQHEVKFFYLLFANIIIL